jgi:hypothetical protein
MRRHAFLALILALFEEACGSGGNGAKPEAGRAWAPEASSWPDSPGVPEADGGPVGLDGAVSGPGCDEAVMGVDHCIKNPGILVNGVPIGGGTRVLRQDPVPCVK